MTATDQPELLPCPFCGGEARWVEDTGALDTPFGLVTDHTPTCFLSGRMMTEWGDILAAWNTRLTSTTPTLGDMVMPGVTLVKREADKECGCPEEEWETPWGYLSMHLNAGEPSDAALDNAEAGEWETSITAPTIEAARAAIFGWAALVASQPPVEGSAIGRALREMPDERFREIVDSLDVGRARSLIAEMMVDLRAALAAAPASPIPTSVADEDKVFTHAPWHPDETIEQYRERMTGRASATSVANEGERDRLTVERVWTGLRRFVMPNGRPLAQHFNKGEDQIAFCRAVIAALSPALDNTAVEGLCSAVTRYMAAVKALGTRSTVEPSRNLFDERPMSAEGVAAWQELNDAGKQTTAALATLTVQTEKAR